MTIKTAKLKLVKIAIILTAFFIFYLAGRAGAGVTANAQPGTQNDPLVSRSYLDSRLAALEAEISALAAALQGHPTSTAPVPPTFPDVPAIQRELFTVVRAEAGSVLIGGASAEIILRAGEATIIAGENGLANVTAGHDIMNGQRVPLNNLLIVPLADGRGLRFHTVAYLMVKGDFHLA